MNSDARRIISQFDSRGGSDVYRYYADGQRQDKIVNPTAIATIILLVVTISYQAAYQQGRVPSVSQLLWDVCVFVSPARLLYAVESFTNPPLFPRPMLRTQPSTHAAKSDLLRKILRLDKPGGLLNSVTQAGLRGLGSYSGGRAAKPPPGLGNYDNACYQNSIIQGLASLSPLQTYLSTLPLEKMPDPPPCRTVDALRAMIENLHGPSNHGKTLWTPRVLKNMSTWQQQDAQEYYSKLLDQIDKEIAKVALALQKKPGFDSDCLSDDSSSSQGSFDSGYHSLPDQSGFVSELRSSRNPLEGLMAQRVACVACGHCEGLTMIPFNCLTLSLGNSSEHDIYERLEHYTKLEAIGGVECVKCTLLDLQSGLQSLLERAGELPQLRQRLQAVQEAIEEASFDDQTLVACKVSPKMRVNSTKTKQVAIARPPQSLVFHMNRSVFDEKTGYMFKNSAAVRFPMVLDLGPWCLGSAGGKVNWTGGEGADVPASPVGVDEEQWPLDPRTSMVAGDRQPSRIVGPIYELRAVVTHQGHHEAGHYVCYRRHPVSAATVAGNGGEGTEPPTTSDSEKSGDLADGLQDPEDEPDHESQTSSQDELRPSQWWRFSDETVTEVDESTVLNQPGVFMLFYDCVDPDSVLVSAADGEAGGRSPPTIPTPTSNAVGRQSSASLADGDVGSKATAGGEAEGERSVLSEASTVPLPEGSENDGL
ncbi:hypothetical protein VTK26DRAFT_1721 [Humicola hyalothermophila]